MAQKPKWTAAARAAFIASLAECGEVRAALATVGLSPKSAYRLRATDPDFARAWDTALLHSRQTIVAELTSRALHGWQEEVWFRGELVGTRTRHDSRLLLALVARLDAAAGQADEARIRRAAPQFADVLAALRHDVPLDPWFAASMAEKQEQAIDKAVQRQRFWHYAALMDDDMIEDVMGSDPDDEPCQDEDDNLDQYDPQAAFDDQRQDRAPAPEAPHVAADEAALSSPRGCYPVLPMDAPTGESPGPDLAGPASDCAPPCPPPAERPPGPLSAVERDAVEGDMAALCLQRISPFVRLNPFAPPP
jgi:hypothetical protein